MSRLPGLVRQKRSSRFDTHLLPKVLEIWQSAAFEYEKVNPAVKIEFDYLENEEFKAKLAVAAGAQSPEQATQVIEHSWSKSRISVGIDMPNIAQKIVPNNSQSDRSFSMCDFGISPT